MKAGTEVRNECVNLLDNTHSMGNDWRVRVRDVKERLVQSHREDSKELTQVLAEQKRIYREYRKYQTLDDRRIALERRMERTIVARGIGEFPDIDAGKTSASLVGTIVDSGLPLWQIIVAIVEQYGELQIVELEWALDELGHDTSRSAIESALATHKEVFQIRRDKRSKFVSLKGAA
jgi:hypothetical protein